MSMPTAFDTALGSNFTESSCPDFFNSFLANSDFIACYPLSFYMKNSKSYFKTVQAGLDSVEAVLNLSCSANTSNCSDLMSSLGDQLIMSSNCLADFSLENPLVTQAYGDFLSYQVVKDATCLTISQAGESLSSNLSSNSTTEKANYCYTKALFNYTDSSDAFLYLLPFGSQYPTAGYDMSPSCSECTRHVMDIFHSQTDNSNLSLIYTYNSAASVIVSSCGDSFINASSIIDDQSKSQTTSATTSNSGSKSLGSRLNCCNSVDFAFVIAMMSLLFLYLFS